MAGLCGRLRGSDDCGGAQRQPRARAVGGGAEIRDYLDPLLGGPDGDGWPFGRDLYLSEMQSVVQSIQGVEYAQDVTLYQVDIQTGQSRAAGDITLAEDVLLLSYEHTVNIAQRDR